MPEKKMIDFEKILNDVGTSKHLDALFSSFAEDTREWKTAEEKAKELYLEDEGRQQAFLNGVQYANQLTAENSKNECFVLQEDISQARRIGFQPNAE